MGFSDLAMADDFRGKAIERKQKPPREPCLTSVSASMTELFRYLILPKELKVRRGKPSNIRATNRNKPKNEKKKKEQKQK